MPVPREQVELHEKYAALAAIHDCDPEVAESVNPWRDGSDNLEGVAYTHNLLRAVPRLPEADELRIYAWVEHVEKDLKAWAGEDEGTPAGQARQPTAGSRATHSLDFRSVRWNDNKFSFTKQQSTIVKLLWNEWLNGTPDVGAEALLEAADAKNSRLIDGFRDHPAWGTMIVDGQTRDTKRIAGDPPHS